MPPEVRVMIWKASLPLGLKYCFNGFSDPELSAKGNKVAALFHCSNHTMYKEAMDIWLAENTFTFSAESIEASQLEVVSSLCLDPPENDLEASLRRIAAMVNATGKLRVTLDINGSLWRMYPQFFALFELLCEYDVAVTLNGRSPLHLTTHSGRVHTLEIRFAYFSKAGEVLLKILDSAHQARALEVPHSQLQRRFDDLLQQEQCLGPISQARPLRVFESLHDINSFSVYPRPSNILYKTPQAAAQARKAVNAGKPPSTRSLQREWVRDHVFQPLREWRQELEAHYAFLAANDPFVPNAFPQHTLSNDTIFGFYGNKKWSKRPTTVNRQIRYKKLCDTELHRTIAHMDAMRPYSA